MPFGVIGTKYIDFPTTIDEAYLKSLQTRSGLELSDLVRLTDQAMGVLNSQFDDVLASLLSFTTEPQTGRRSVGRKYVRKGGEYTIPRAQYGESTEHMLPIDKYEITTGFTEDGLFEISREDFNQELQDVVDAWKMLYKGEAFTALFDPNPQRVAARSSVLSPKFAGSGTGDYAFSGTFPNGSDIPTDYTHYYRTSHANLLATIREMAAQLRRWHQPSYELVGTSNAIDAVVALGEDFIPVGETEIDPGQGVPSARLDPDVYLGKIKGTGVRVRHPEDQLGTTEHFAIYKTYGEFSAGNPLKWLYDDARGRDAYVRGREDYPLAESVVLQWFGIGVGDRVGATVAEINDTPGTYAEPSISF